MPECRIDLYEDETETDDPTVVGENCHIVAEEDGGPRPDPSMPLERRNSYANLILLCRNHHKVIDAQEVEYSVEKLNQMKAEHEAWVRAQLGFNAAKQQDDEYYAGIVDTWERLTHLDHWHGWSSHVLSHGQPSMNIEVDRDLEKLRSWLLNRVWPGRYAPLENSFENFRRVLQDFHERFREHAEFIHGGETLITRKFYKILEWDEARYNRLLKRYEFHVDLVQDLMVELSRAANLICDLVRSHLVRSYRLTEGRVMIQTGPTMDLMFHDIVVQYSPEERALEIPYPGLEKFLTERKDRGFHFGEGTESSS